MSGEAIVVEGRGLHSGAAARVSLARCDGAVTLNGTPIAALRVVDTERETTVETARGRVRTVEHLFAALAGIGVREGMAIEVEGGEVPLADGGAAKWCDAIGAIGVTRAPPLRVVKSGVIEIGRSRYSFVVEVEIEIEVEVEVDGEVEVARWRGDAEDFRARIAPARTFAFARDVDALASRGLASHVDPESVVVIGDGVVHCAGRPFAKDEPARHKLLDLVGDSYLYGGPPIGRVRAFRPGHGATHAAMTRARELGIVARQRA